jgi:raffinose/stachyose/melibiose transport system substrate-binding protein
MTALLAVVALVCAGCGGSSAPGGADKSFTYWSMWKVGEPQQKVIAEAITDFEKQTGIKVNAQWQGRNNLQKLVPALNTNSVPDLVDGPYVKAYPALVATNQTLGLQSAYDAEVDGKKVSELIPEKYRKSIDISLDDGQPWMLPYQIQSDAVWYNAAQHPEIKANPPKTWDEWITMMNELKAKGETPLAADGDIAGYNAAYLSTLMLRNGGPGTLMKTAEDKTGQAWKSPEALNAAKDVEQLVKGNYLIEGYNASKFPAQQQRWANNDAVFMFMGSWLPTESSSYAKPGFEYGSFPFPKTDSHDSARVDFSGFMVPKKAQHPDAAQQFAAFFLGKKYQDAYGLQAKGIPVRSDAAISPELKSVQETINRASSYHQQNDGVAFPGYNEKVLWANSDLLFLGKLSAEEFVAKMAQDQAAYWKNQR